MLTVKYSKLEQARFLSHLDMQTILQRTIKRAGFMPIFTQGFNPRPIFKMSKPLPLGVASKCEYFSVDIPNISKEAFIKDCAGQTPKGIEFLDVWVTERDPKVFNLGAVSEYDILLKNFKQDKFSLVKKAINEGFVVRKKQKRQYIIQDVSNLIVDIGYVKNKMIVRLLSTESLNLWINEFLSWINTLLSADLEISNVVKTNQYIGKEDISIDTYLSKMELNLKK